MTTQIFRTIINQEIRITLMRTMLEKNPRHKDKAVGFDRMIDEFASLNKARNKYVHGLWYTHEDGRLFLEEEASNYLSFHAKRQVKAREITDVIERMQALSKRLWDRERTRMLALALASDAKRLKPASDSSSPADPEAI